MLLTTGINTPNNANFLTGVLRNDTRHTLVVGFDVVAEKQGRLGKFLQLRPTRERLPAGVWRCGLHERDPRLIATFQQRAGGREYGVWIAVSQSNVLDDERRFIRS
jgi:hypothetical protein